MPSGGPGSPALVAKTETWVPSAISLVIFATTSAWLIETNGVLWSPSVVT